MAEVVDIIHNLNYQANTAGIDKANSALEQSILIIGDQADEIKRLETIRAQTDKANIARIAQLNAALEKLKSQYSQELGILQKRVAIQEKASIATQRQITVLGKLIQEQNKARIATDRFAQSSNSATHSLLSFSRIVQDAPFGFLGIANNLNPALESFQRLREETGSNKSALQSLIGTLKGPAGIGIALSVVSSLLIVFGDKLFSASKEAVDMSKDLDKLSSSVENLIDKQNKLNQIESNLFSSKSVAARKRQLDLVEALNDGNLESEQKAFEAIENLRVAELQSLQKKQQGYEQLARYFEARKKLPNLDPFELRELVPDGVELAEAEAIYTDALDKKLNIVKSFQDKVDQISIEIEDNRSKQLINQINFDKKRADIVKKNAEELKRQEEENARQAEEAYKNAIKKVEDQAEINELNDQALQLLRAQIQSQLEVRLLIRQGRADRGEFVSEEVRKAEDAEYEQDKKRLETIIKLRELTLKANTELSKAGIADQFGKTGDAAKFKLKAQELDITAEETKLTLGEVIAPIKTNTATAKVDISGSRRSQREIDEAIGASDKDNERRKKKLQEAVTIYKSFEQSIGDILDDISERQIRALDVEISVRRDRVAAAEKLAERGNTEILRLETERLEASEKARESAARRQMAINAALALSNAIVAVATTAAETGVGSIAAIPAVLAALVAGYGFVRSLDNSTGFKDGEVDIQGPGTTKSDSIPARLSRGESVINAEATARWKPLLEDINSGREPRFIEYVKRQRSSTGGDKKLYKKMDQLIDATENNPVNVSQRIDENGVAQIVESARKIKRRRYS